MISLVPAARKVESDVSALKNGDPRLLIVALGTLAAFGSIVLGAVFFAILKGLGMNQDLAWGLSVLMWIAVLALGVVSFVYFYDSIKKRVEQVTGSRAVVSPPPTPSSSTVETNARSNQDKPSSSSARPSSYRSMLLEGDRKDDQSK